MKIDENTVWGDIDPSMKFLDHPAFPNNKPKLSVMGYNKDDIPGGDIPVSKKLNPDDEGYITPEDKEPKYTSNGEINPFHDIEEPIEDPSYTDVIYGKLEDKIKVVEKLENTIAHKDRMLEGCRIEIDRLVKQIKTLTENQINRQQDGR